MFYPLTVGDYLYRAEQVYPDRKALVDEPDQEAAAWMPLSYAEVARLARSQAAAWDQLGVPVGARIAAVSQNSARLLTSFFGVSGWGRILVPINFRLTAAEVGYIVEHSGADVVMVDPSLRPLLDGLDCRHKFVFGENDQQLWEAEAEPQAWCADEGATATINYTSGTTARPKGVQLSHRSLWLNAATFGWQLQINDNDVYLHTLPMFHANGWGMPYAVTGMGARHVVLRQVDGTEILRRVDEHGVTVMCAAPAVLAAVLDAAADWDGPIPGRGRTRVVVAGAPPATRLIERIRSDLGWEFVQIYGLTETSPFLTMSRMRAEWRELGSTDQAGLGRAGAPGLGVRLSIDPGGEVLAASNHNLEAYWRNPEATAAAQANGVFHTGDGGVIDGGHLTIHDRKKDIVITGGENVSSIEVENVLASHPAVREVAVIGVPDDTWGERVTALVVAKEQTSEDELIQYCRAHLAGYKCPKTVEFRTELARTATGKLQKFKLREAYWGTAARQVN